MTALALLVVLASPIDVKLVPSAVQGHGVPAVIAVANVSAKNVKLQLSRTGCGAESHARASVAKLAAGEEHRFNLEQPAGHCRYAGELEAVIGGQNASLPLAFETDLVGPPEVKAMPNGLDRENHTVHVAFSQVADHGAVEAFDSQGKSLGAITDQELGDAAPLEPLALEYREGPALARLRVTVYAKDGAYAAVDLFPWEVRVPHEEVVFASGSAEIGATERPKLEESLRRIKAEMAKVSGQIPARLFVAGYTDTVGSAESNQRLSAQRAASLGKFFRSGGLAIPVLTAGLGEEALAVATPDDTDEPRNRRAEYILAVEPPEILNAKAQPSWEALK